MVFGRRSEVSQEGVAVLQSEALDGKINELYHTRAAVRKNNFNIRRRGGDGEPNRSGSGPEIKRWGVEKRPQRWREQQQSRIYKVLFHVGGCAVFGEASPVSGRSEPLDELSQHFGVLSRRRWRHERVFGRGS